MEKERALDYLRKRCFFPDMSREVLLRHWSSARRLLQPIPNAGRPDIREVPSQYLPYLEGVKASPRFTSTVQNLPWSFKLLEIEPLLAFQFHVIIDRADDLCGRLNSASTMDSILRICLPHHLEEIDAEAVVEGNGIRITSPTLNVRLFAEGKLTYEQKRHLVQVEVGYGMASPLVHALRLNGRCYLRNGFHRAYGLRRLGFTHLPCLLLEAADFAQLGATGADATFECSLLESTNPPTCGHLTRGQGYPVSVRTATKEITISWAESILRAEG